MPSYRHEVGAAVACTSIAAIPPRGLSLGGRLRLRWTGRPVTVRHGWKLCSTTFGPPRVVQGGEQFGAVTC
jgi:hypothetical protein